MQAIKKRMRTFLAEENGPTVVEYAFMLALIVGVALGAIQFLGTSVRNVFIAVLIELGGVARNGGA